jgi:hypothetical protein
MLEQSVQDHVLRKREGKKAFEATSSSMIPQFYITTPSFDESWVSHK